MRADRYRHMLEMMEEPIEAPSGVQWSFAETRKLIKKRLNEFENDIAARLNKKDARLDKKPSDIWKKYIAIKRKRSWLDKVDDRVLCQLLRLNYKEMHDMYLDDYCKAFMATPKNKRIDFPAFNLWLTEKAKNE